MKTLLFQIILFFALLVAGIAQDQPSEKQAEAERTAVEKIEAVGGTVRKIAATDDRLEVDFQIQGSSVVDNHLAPLEGLEDDCLVGLGKHKRYRFRASLPGHIDDAYKTSSGKNENNRDLPAFFGPPITGEQRQSAWLSRSRVLLGQREPASPASAHRHPSQHGAAL